MRYFTDTSFLCALYREQDNSARADAFMAGLKGDVILSSLVLWEFRQSARFQVFRHGKDRPQGFSKAVAEKMMAILAANLNAGGLVVASVEWPDVHSLAEQLSAKHTMSNGHRPLDILHVATAKHLKLNRFLSFDDNQMKLAKAEGLRVPL